MFICVVCDASHDTGVVLVSVCGVGTYVHVFTAPTIRITVAVCACLLEMELRRKHSMLAKGLFRIRYSVCALQAY